MIQQRIVFFVSDGTGITAETLGNTLLTQFENFEFKKVTLPFVTDAEKAKVTVDYIDHIASGESARPIIFSTTTKAEVRSALQNANALFLDLFDTYIGPIEAELGVKSSHASGRAHGISNKDGRYDARIAAIDFAMEHDDGQRTRGLEQADVILIAPSRCGKTPTSIYLALQHGLLATNYPLTDDDLEVPRLPASLNGLEKKLFGLTTEPQRLHQVRTERRSGSRYASLAQCAFEVRQAEILYRRHQIPHLNSANMSIEEIATMVLQQMNLRR